MPSGYIACFSLGLRDVELILAGRGVIASFQSIRDWRTRFGRLFATMPKRARPKPADEWFTDEVFIRIQGKLHCLWRTVDQDGTVPDILVRSGRDAKAASRFFHKLLQGLPDTRRVIVTNKLRSYAAAKREMLTKVGNRQRR
jgi:putative transposase